MASPLYRFSCHFLPMSKLLLSTREISFLSLPEQHYTGCPTRYRTRHFFNNFTTNEDIATKFEADLPHCARNVTTSHTTYTFLFISHTTNVRLFKFRCNIFIGVRIIKEMLGSVASGTLCILCAVLPQLTKLSLHNDNELLFRHFCYRILVSSHFITQVCTNLQKSQYEEDTHTTSGSKAMKIDVISQLTRRGCNAI